MSQPSFGSIRTWSWPIGRVIVWTTVIATIAWSIGAAFLIQVPPARAVVPTLLGGGPADTQEFVPDDALVDINASIDLLDTTITTSSVLLRECSGTDHSSSTAACGSSGSPTVGSQLCTTVSYSNVTDKITCNHNRLTAGKWHDFRVTTGVREDSGGMPGDPLAANVVRRFKTGATSGGTNTTPPKVVDAFPKAGLLVPTNTNLSVQFPTGPEGDMKTTAGGGGANAVDNVSNVSLKKLDSTTHTVGAEICTTGTACVLTWSSGDRVLTVNPASNLDASSEYDFCTRAAIQNAQNQNLAGDYCVHFTTGAAADSSAPTLRATGPTVPADAATGVSRYTPEFQVAFSEGIDPTTVTLSTVRLYVDDGAGGGVAADGVRNGTESLLGSASLSIRFEPMSFTTFLGSKAALAANTRHCFEIVGGGSGVKDVSGNAVAATITNKCFTTGADADSTGPKLMFVDADNYKLVAHFSEVVKGGTGANGAENTANYTFECPTGVGINLTGKTMTYKPEFKELEITGLGLPVDQSCRLTVTSTLQDLAGNAFDTSGSPANNVANFKVLSSATTGGVLGTSGTTDFQTGTTFSTFWEKPQRCEPRAHGTGQSTSVECEFPVPQALTTGAKLLLAFPTGFTVTNATAPSATTSYMNGDLNGPGGPGTTTISGVAVDNTAGTVTLTLGHSGAAMGSTDMLRLELSSITTPSTPGTDLRISIIVKDSAGIKVGQTIQPMPFGINQAGSLSIAGKVCKGSTSGGACAGGDTAIASVKIFCDQMGGYTVGTTTSGFTGHSETSTAADGTYTISGLTAGQYGCMMPPDPTRLADTGGATTFQQVVLSDASKTGLDFKLTDLASTGRTLTVTVSGINDSDTTVDADIFCHAGYSSFDFSAPAMKAFDFATAGNTTVTLKLQPGKTYECGLGPHIAFEQFSNGAPPPPPDFTFLPPRMQQVVVPADADPAGISFPLNSANLTIVGRIVDGAGTNIANAFVHAQPVSCFDPTSGAVKDCFGSFAQSNSTTGTSNNYTLKVMPGTYELGADGPGLPPSTREEVTVKSDGTLIQGGTTVTAVTLKIVKSSTTIAGQVLDDSGNGIKYAHVSGQKITTGGSCSSFTSAGSGGYADSPTDESGNYTLYVSTGTWCIRAFSPAYGEVGTKTVVMASTSLTGQNIQATATNFGTISGTVTKGGTAVSGAFVNCFSPGTGGNGGQSQTGGTYSLKVKLPSSGTATYTCDGFAPGIGTLGRSTTTLGGGTSTATVNFTVGNPATITVTITNITDAFCDARDSNGLGAPAGKASSAGVYTINVPAGTYTVRCGGPKYGSLVSQANVTVTAGGTASVTGTAPTTRSVTGRITDGSSNLDGATVTFSDSASGKSFTVTTGAQTGTGSNLSGTAIPEGTYNVTVTKKGYAPATTTATVSGGNLTLSSPIACTKASGTDGTSVTVNVQESGSAYASKALVVATQTSGGTTKTVVDEIDATTGAASLALTNGTWTVKAIGDNGKEATATTVTVTNGSASATPTLSLANAISGYTAASESETVALSSGGLLKYEGLAVAGKAPEVNIPASTLSTSDASSGKVEMKADPTLKDIDPGADLNFIGKSGYDITPKDANGGEIKTLSGSVTITIPYTDADVSTAGVDESKIQLGSYNTATQTWETFPTTVDTANNLLTATVSHFSSFGVLGSASTGGGAATDSTPPAAVSGAAATASATAVTLTWRDPSDTDLDSVEVLRSNPPSTAVSGTPLTRVAKGTQRYVDATVEAGKAYTYILRSRDKSGNTKNSGDIAVTVPAAGAPATTATPAPTPTTTTTTTTGGGGATTTTPTTTPTTTTPATAPGLAAIGLSGGDLVKASGRAVYLVGADGKRYTYPNETTYKSWHQDFGRVKTITDAQLASLPLGGAVTVRAGTWLVKIESDPKVYAIEPGGNLRWVETENRAQTLYGATWNRQIIDLPVSLWVTYRVGTPLGADQHPTGSLIRSSGSANVYYVDQGKKRLVSTDAFSGLGFQSSFIRSLAPTIVYEEGPALSATTNLRFARY